MLWSVEPAETMLQEPLAAAAVPLAQPHEHGDEAIACEGEAPLLIRAAGRDERRA